MSKNLSQLRVDKRPQRWSEAWIEQERKRLLEKIEVQSNGCWRWKGPLISRGYGFHYELRTKQINAKKYVGAHVRSYEVFKGKYNKGLVIDHTCENSLCINPEHLQAITQSENMKQHYKRLRERRK